MRIFLVSRVKTHVAKALVSGNGRKLPSLNCGRDEDPVETWAITVYDCNDWFTDDWFTVDGCVPRTASGLTCRTSPTMKAMQPAVATAVTYIPRVDIAASVISTTRLFFPHLDSQIAHESTGSPATVL